MKPYLNVLTLVLATQGFWYCSNSDTDTRFQSTATIFPDGLTGKWEVKLPNGLNANQFQAGLTIEPSGDSLVWSYFSRFVDSTSGRILTTCGPKIDKMPVWWDDSLKVIQVDHGQNRGYGFDFLTLEGQGHLRIRSPWLAPACQGPTGFNGRQLVLSRVNSFHPSL